MDWLRYVLLEVVVDVCISNLVLVIFEWVFFFFEGVFVYNGFRFFNNVSFVDMYI